MKKSKSSKNYSLNKFDEMYEIPPEEITTIENISKMLFNKNECSKCKESKLIELKKFKLLNEQLNLDKLDDDFARCSCGKRHIDIVMAHILKIMKEENIELRKFILRNGPTPLLTPMFNTENEPFIEKNSLIILHPKFTKDIALKIINDVSEVKGVIKGNPKDTVGIVDIDSEAISYELLAGSDVRSDILQSPVGKIIINKIQHLSYLEFPPSMENKIKKIWEYIQAKHLTKEEFKELNIIDGTCGNGTLGIFLLKSGVKKIIFNDIWKPSAVMTSMNLKANGFEIIEENYKKITMDKITIMDKIATGYNFEVYNLSFEELAEKLFKNQTAKEKILKKNVDENNKDKTAISKFDLCIIDCFPGVDTIDFEKTARLLSKDVLII